jgi:hypothetical protein
MRQNLSDADLTGYDTTVTYLAVNFIKRLGPDPHAGGAKTSGCYGCPDIWELDGGDFAVIGADITELAGKLPPSASCGPDERVVRIPRQTLVLAKPDIPNRI